MTSKRDDAAAPTDAEQFLSRWSRLKEEARQQPPAASQTAAVSSKDAAPDLPPLDQLTMDSDFRGFFHPKVSDDVRRAALKKLFSDPHFNVMDGLDVYIDDYSKTEPIPAAMLAGLKQAQNILQWAREGAEERRKAEENAVRQTTAEPPALEPPQAQTDAGGLEVKTAEPVPVRISDTDGPPRS